MGNTRNIKYRTSEDKLELKRVEEGDNVFTQFQQGREAFIIKSGTVELYRTNSGGVSEKENSR